MVSLSQRIGTAISTAELERRWAAARAAMDGAGIDVLLVHGTNDYLGGYVRWFTDIPATTGYPVSLVFAGPGDIRFVSQGSFGLDMRPGPVSPYRGVSRVLGAPGYASAGYTSRYEGVAVAAALADFARGTIGLVGPALSARLLDHLRETYPSARFVDACDLIDPIKADKSAEEVALIRRTAAMQDACLDSVRDALRPGLRDLEVAAIAEAAGRSMESEQGIFLVASAPAGEAAVYGIRRYQHRTIEAGDVVSVLIENSGPGGFYTEIGRTFVLGRASDAMREVNAVAVAQQHAVAARLAVGALPAEAWTGYNADLEAAGFAPEQRLFCHGQGYDLVERPLIRFDEPMPLGRTTNIACHPTIVRPDLFVSVCDNYLIADGRAERLHRSDQGLIELR